MAGPARWNGRLRLVVGAASVLLVVTAGQTARGASSDGRHVVTFGPASRELLRTAVSASPTVATLVEALVSTDVIVVVEVSRDRFGAAGDLRIQAIAGSARYLRIRVSGFLDRWDQIAILGHELQHANEVARATDVRDQDGLARLMRRIGRETLRGNYETTAAEETTARVRREVAR